MASSHVFRRQVGDAGIVRSGKHIRIHLPVPQRDEPKAHAVDCHDHRLERFRQVFPRAHCLDANPVQVVQCIQHGEIAPAFHLAAVFDVVGRHAHQVETGPCRRIGVIRPSYQLEGAGAAGLRHPVGHGGVEHAYRQVGAGDELTHFFVEIVRVPVLVQRRLDAARRHDHAGEQQGGDRRLRSVWPPLSPSRAVAVELGVASGAVRVGEVGEAASCRVGEGDGERLW